MASYHPACKECVLNHDCLFQKDDDVEGCGDVQDYGFQKRKKSCEPEDNQQ